MYLDEDIFEQANRVVRAAIAAGTTLGTAESCTGGLVSGALTAVAGSSAVVRGGIVSYDPAIKESVLGVSVAITHDPAIGVVSSECARAMAEGARAVLGCDVAVSITGIAGPGGAEPGKPVGTVWFGLASATGATTRLCHFDGDRAQVRAQAVRQALELLEEGIGA